MQKCTAWSLHAHCGTLRTARDREGTGMGREARHGRAQAFAAKFSCLRHMFIPRSLVAASAHAHLGSRRRRWTRTVPRGHYLPAPALPDTLDSQLGCLAGETISLNAILASAPLTAPRHAHPCCHGTPHGIDTFNTALRRGWREVALGALRGQLRLALGCGKDASANPSTRGPIAPPSTHHKR